MIQKIARKVIHVVTGTRKFYHKKLREFSKDLKNADILEFGSGKKVNGDYSYSAKHLFDASNNFICSDINPEFNHKVVDITKMQDKEKYDVVLCMNVLEHVYDINSAVKNLHKSLKKGGRAIISVPATFPLHDEPHDYWRFTEHSLRRLFEDFTDLKIDNNGHRKFPIGYFVEAKK